MHCTRILAEQLYIFCLLCWSSHWCTMFNVRQDISRQGHHYGETWPLHPLLEHPRLTRPSQELQPWPPQWEAITLAKSYLNILLIHNYSEHLHGASTAPFCIHRSWMCIAHCTLHIAHVLCLCRMAVIFFHQYRMVSVYNTEHIGINSNPGGCRKKDINVRHSVHIDFYFQERGCEEWTRMCRFYFYE